MLSFPSNIAPVSSQFQNGYFAPDVTTGTANVIKPLSDDDSAWLRGADND